MTEEIREKANELAKEIKETREDLLHCKVMIENKHTRLYVKSCSIGYYIPEDIASGVLQLSKDAIERKLEKLEKEYSEL
jgi:molecular chaperone GrpE (heat shock protein)